MDTPRRWQVASLATAVAGLTFGGIMMGRSPSEAVPAIELEVREDAPSGLEGPEAGGGEGSGLELVPPSVLEDPTPPSPDSVASPEEPTVSGAGAPAAGPGTSPPAEVPSAPDTPSSISSPDSFDSDE